MTTDRGSRGTVRELLAELAATEEELCSLRLATPDHGVADRRRAVVRRQAELVGALRRRRTIGRLR